LICHACDYAFEHKQSIHDPVLRKCPKCTKEALEQDYSKKQISINDGVCKTIGQQAEKNRKEMSKELFQREAERMAGPKAAAKRNAKTPWWREEGTKALDLKSVKDTKKFILTGEKN